ncbi:uncharacterized conserved protein [Moesziomyces antarcticus T-34]|uniref:Uncharacterized conserved protein n=1 Tax=Pseudozyma antarctica (strain T-34) TaxID=1151754 RepID=M9MAM4_PSEA3|nr:uncharacterized conserved protein [Moesziomyces antarcticus T-34]
MTTKHSTASHTTTSQHSIADQHLVRGPKHHLKRLNAPSSWMLDKLSGTYAPRPSNGPHKLREALPLVVSIDSTRQIQQHPADKPAQHRTDERDADKILLRNRLKYALTGREVNAITAQRLIKVDGKVRTDPTYPTGFQDVVSIEKSGEHFRILYDAKGRFIVHRITAEEATYKLLKVKKVQLGARGVPHVVTHDGRTIRYPDPAIKVNDTVRFDIESQKILDFVTFDTGATVMVTGGRNMGRAGVITGKERHLGGFDIVHIRDVLGRDFSTRLSNVFVIGTDGKPMISMPRGGGVKLTITEERDQRRRQKEARGQ